MFLYAIILHHVENPKKNSISSNSLGEQQFQVEDMAPENLRSHDRNEAKKLVTSRATRLWNNFGPSAMQDIQQNS